MTAVPPGSVRVTPDAGGDVAESGGEGSKLTVREAYSSDATMTFCPILNAGEKAPTAVVLLVDPPWLNALFPTILDEEVNVSGNVRACCGS
jgi:hypothetical protein